MPSPRFQHFLCNAILVVGGTLLIGGIFVPLNLFRDPLYRVSTADMPGNSHDCTSFTKQGRPGLGAWLRDPEQSTPTFNTKASLNRYLIAITSALSIV